MEREGVKFLMNEQGLWFWLKLLALTLVFYVLINVVVPLLSLSPAAVVTSLVMAVLTWGLWTLRRIAPRGDGRGS
jgi:O-antigen/teichoic acid export membrane protein